MKSKTVHTPAAKQGFGQEQVQKFHSHFLMYAGLRWDSWGRCTLTPTPPLETQQVFHIMIR